MLISVIKVNHDVLNFGNIFVKLFGFFFLMTFSFILMSLCLTLCYAIIVFDCTLVSGQCGELCREKETDDPGIQVPWWRHGAHSLGKGSGLRPAR